jgi:hypothetical protein
MIKGEQKAVAAKRFVGADAVAGRPSLDEAHA